MKTKNLLLILIVSTYFFSGSCGKGGDTPPNTDPCAGVSISVVGVKTDAGSGVSNGTITVTSPTGTGFTYSINGGAFSTTTTFTGLAIGNYTITAKNGNGCTGSAQFSIILDPCIGKTIIVTTPTVNGATPCAANDGSITVSATGSSGFTFNIGGGAFQASPSFNALAAGTYTLGARDLDGCVRTTTATVSPKPIGPLFSAVRTVIQANCATAGCHTGSSPQSGINYSNDCTIVSGSARIKARAVDGIPSFMPPPPNPQLSAADKLKITNWINAGALYTN